MALGSNPINARLSYIFGRFGESQSSFSTTIFFHLVRENNKEAYRYANQSTLNKEGTIVLNNMELYQPVA
jgi:hypothetical protein